MANWLGHDRTLQIFRDRFEPTDGGYLFRAKATSAPVKISEAEYAAAVATFERQMNWLLWGGPILFLVVFCGIAGMQIWQGNDPGQVEIYLPTVAFIIVLVIVWLRLWTAPNRAFERKPVAGITRSKGEARRLALVRLSWSQLASYAGIALFGIWHFSEGFSEGRWNILWAVLAVGICLLFAYRAFTKWQADRDQRLFDTLNGPRP